MRLTSIASGSSGNCVYVGSNQGHILVDTGISRKRIELGLNELDVSCDDIDAILITHEHIDHICGLGVMARKHHIPIYTTPKTWDTMIRHNKIGKVDEDLFKAVVPDEPFQIQDLMVNATSIWHDAADPVCYSIECEQSKVSIATDLGDYNNHILHKLKDSNALFIEANHDVKMLEVGPYPYHLKQRILGRDGHLSNDSAGKLICELMNAGLQQIFLGHLSKDNNFEELAYETVKQEIMKHKEGKDIQLQVAKRDFISELVTV